MLGAAGVVVTVGAAAAGRAAVIAARGVTGRVAGRVTGRGAGRATADGITERATTATTTATTDGTVIGGDGDRVVAARQRAVAAARGARGVRATRKVVREAVLGRVVRRRGKALAIATIGITEDAIAAAAGAAVETAGTDDVIKMGEVTRDARRHPARGVG